MEAQDFGFLPAREVAPVAHVHKAQPFDIGVRERKPGGLKQDSTQIGNVHGFDCGHWRRDIVDALDRVIGHEAGAVGRQFDVLGGDVAIAQQRSRGDRLMVTVLDDEEAFVGKPSAQIGAKGFKVHLGHGESAQVFAHLGLGAGSAAGDNDTWLVGVAVRKMGRRGDDEGKQGGR